MKILSTYYAFYLNFLYSICFHTQIIIFEFTLKRTGSPYYWTEENLCTKASIMLNTVLFFIVRSPLLELNINIFVIILFYSSHFPIQYVHFFFSVQRIGNE